jgi:hypothetical protein
VRASAEPRRAHASSAKVPSSCKEREREGEGGEGWERR